MIDTFTPPRTPSQSSFTPKTSFDVLKASYGDGYEQRTPNGINYKRTSVTLVWSALTQAQLNELMVFFDDKAWVPFLYTLPDEDVERVWILAGEYSRSVDGSGTSFTFEAPMQESFDQTYDTPPPPPEIEPPMP